LKYQAVAIKKKSLPMKPYLTSIAFNHIRVFRWFTNRTIPRFSYLNH